MGLADALISRIDKLIQDRLDAAISSRLAASDYTAPDNSGIGSIKTKTDLIPASGPASAAYYTQARAAALDLLDAAISLVKAKTDLIPASGPADAASYTGARAAKLDFLDVAASAIKNKTDLIPAAGPPSATDYSAVRAAKLDNLDALISSRLAASAYTVPPTAAAIWAAATRTLTAAPSVISSIQTGYATSSGWSTSGSSGSEDYHYKDITISGVDVSKAVVLICPISPQHVYSADYSLSARLTSSTNLRVGWTEGYAPVRWYVITFA